MKKMVGFVLGALVLVGVAGTAHATVGYLCTVDGGFGKGYSSFGNYGGIQLTVYSSPACSGSFVGGGWLCSNGSTSSACSSPIYYNLDEDQLLQIFGGLQRAAASNQKVWIGFDGSGYPYNVEFYSAGF
jgi:hypothetical protein